MGNFEEVCVDTNMFSSMEVSFFTGYTGRADFFDKPSAYATCPSIDKNVFHSLKKDICIVFAIVYHEISCPINEIPDSFWYAMGVYVNKVRSTCGGRGEYNWECVSNDWAEFKKSAGVEWIRNNNVSNDLLLEVNSILRAEDFDPFADK